MSAIGRMGRLVSGREAGVAIDEGFVGRRCGKEMPEGKRVSWKLGWGEADSRVAAVSAAGRVNSRK